MLFRSKYYCVLCLRKWQWREVPSTLACPFCNIPLRGSFAARVDAVVNTLMRLRSTMPPKKKSDYYETYLESQLWKMIRERVHCRDNYKCQVCFKPAQVVHHKNYDAEVMDGQRDADLISLCHNCHSAIEFEITNGKKVKNSLQKANGKLAKIIDRRCKT